MESMAGGYLTFSSRDFDLSFFPTKEKKKIFYKSTNILNTQNFPIEKFQYLKEAR